MGVLNIRIFKDESGSAALTVLIALVLTIALISVSLQWYWTNTTSADIQYLADSGALAAGEAAGKIATTIQVLDLVLLTMNLFGLVIHAITIVAGIIAASGSPFSVAVAGFLPRAIEFDRKYVDARKRFSDAAFTAAKRASDAAPYLMFGYATATVNDNIKLRADYNATSYKIVPIPFPARGTVTRSTNYDENQILEDVAHASEKNSDNAAELQVLEAARQAVLDAAYNADVYKDLGDMYATWKLEDALGHFRNEYESLRLRARDDVVALIPIDEASQPARDRLREAYLRDCDSIMDEVLPEVSKGIGTYDHESEMYTAKSLTVGGLFSEVRSKEIYLLDHDEQSRKAYHSRANCTGLQNAQSELNKIKLEQIIGDIYHPPCSLCLPVHYGSIQKLASLSDPFVDNWNTLVVLIERHNQLTREIQELAADIRTQSSSAFDQLIANAKEYLSAGRLSYEPAGARGILCVAFSTSSRNLPRFTLPNLTNSADIELGPQVALAASRLYPTKVTEAVQKSAETINNNIRHESPNMGGSISGLLDGDDGLSSMMVPIWKACTSAITRNDSKLENIAGDLPWGVGPLLQSTLKRLKDAVGLAAPDTRTLKPFLVNTALIGDPGAPGAEGIFVKNIRAAKKTYEQTGGGSVAGLSAVIEESLTNYEGNIGQRIRSVIVGSFGFGGAIRLPFYAGLDNATESSITWAKGHLHELVGLMP